MSSRAAGGAGAGGDRVLLAITAAGAALLACFQSTDGDLGFHLATGRYVLAHGEIPARNVLSFTQPEQPWLLHQWLPATLFELVHRSFGFVGLGVLKMAVVGLLFALVFRTARAIGSSAVGAAIACLVAAWAAAFRFELRPLLFTHLTLAGFLWCVARAFAAGRAGANADVDAGADADAGAAAGAESMQTQRRWLGAAAVLAAVGCQLHAGALDTFVACGALGLGCLIEPLRAKMLGGAAPADGSARGQAHAPSGVRAFTALAAVGLGGLALAALALALYHPHGPRILLFPLDMAGDAYLREHLVEFRAPTRFPFEMLAGYWGLLGLVTVTCVARVRHVHAALLVLVAVFAVLSLRHVRLAFGFAVVSAPVLALGVDAVLAALRGRGRGQASAGVSTNVGAGAGVSMSTNTSAGVTTRADGIAYAVLAALLVLAPLDTFRKLPFGFGTVETTWPKTLFAELDALHVQGEGFVSDAWAGPMLGVFYPRHRAYWDNRFEAYSREFFRTSYQDVRYGKPGWDRELDRHGVQWALLRYTSPAEAKFQSGAPNLRQLLSRDARWTLVSFDDRGALWLRADGVNAGVATRDAIPGLDPDRGSFHAPPRQALAGMRALLARNATSARAHVLGAVAAKDAGEPALAREWITRATRLDPAAPGLGQVRQMLER